MGFFYRNHCGAPNEGEEWRKEAVVLGQGVFVFLWYNGRSELVYVIVGFQFIFRFCKRGDQSRTIHRRGCVGKIIIVIDYLFVLFFI
ncbi:Uncharacterised protein [uncultured Clostridium sp.]|nr:Uncharacterised protein [uncultured Clostridium sp.]